ncbi:hypothetical protein LCGC14_0595050 [marine sediment metagenome]|uniref:Uncharacterized protein n=1 Tax=marine sediment metagenome TaxID=412755 RepID=A0A0F9TYE1_9ZZZZ
MRHIGFKSERWFFDQLFAGRKTWDARLDDLTDDRIYALHFSHTRNAEPQQDVETITFTDTDHIGTREITFRFDRLEYGHWAPGWCFLILGERVNTPADVFFGPTGLAIDDHEIPAWARFLKERWIGKVILVLGRWGVPKLIWPLPTRLQDIVKRSLPCVFGKQGVPHVQCYCVAVFSVTGREVRCGESYNSANHHGVLGTHRYLAPESCQHQEIDPGTGRGNKWIL